MSAEPHAQNWESRPDLRAQCITCGVTAPDGPWIEVHWPDYRPIRNRVGRWARTHAKNHPNHTVAVEVTRTTIFRLTEGTTD